MANEYIIGGKLILDVADAAKKLKEVETQTKGIEGTTKKSLNEVSKDWLKAGQKMESIGGKMTKTLTLPIIAMGTAMVQFASNQEEASNKVDELFDDASDNVKEWSKVTAETLGMSKREALELAGSFGALSENLGLSKDESAAMSMQLATLAVDMASFHNVSVDRAGVALKGIFTGETEALKSLGIVMNEAALSQFVMANGSKKAWKEMTNEEKVMWRLKYVMQSTSTLQGDFARNADGVANSSKIAKAKLEDMAASFGEKLLPVVTSVLEKLTGVMDQFMDLPESTQSAILWGAGIIAVLGPVIATLGKVATGIGNITALFAKGGLSLATLGWVGAAAAVVGGIAGLAVSIKGEYDRIYEDANGLNESMGTLNSAMDKARADYDKQRVNIAATAEQASLYIDKLEQLERTGLRTKQQQKEYAAVVEKLKQLMPELNISLDKQTGKIEGGTKALRENAEAWEQVAIQSALMKKQEAELEAVADAYIALWQAKNKAKQNDQQIMANQRRMDTLNREIAKGLGMTVDEYESLGAVAKGNAFRGASSEIQNMRLEVIQLEQKTSELTRGQTALNNAVAQAETTYATAQGQVASTTQMISEQADAVDGAKESIDKYSGSVDDMNKTIEDAGTAIEEAKPKINDFTTDVMDSSDKITLRSRLNGKRILKNAQANLEALKTTQTNMAELQSKGVSEAYLLELYNMGEAGWQQLQALNKMTEPQLQKFIKLYDEAGGLAHLEFKDGVWKIKDEVKNANDATEKEAKTGGEDVGKALGAGVVAGINFKKGAVNAAAAALTRSAVLQSKKAVMIESPSKVTRDEIGKPFAQGVGVGIEDEMKNVLKKVKKGTLGIVAGISPKQNNTAARLASNASKAKAVGGNTITQNNTFTSKELSPHEQRVQLKKLDNDLQGVFA